MSAGPWVVRFDMHNIPYLYNTESTLALHCGFFPRRNDKWTVAEAHRIAERLNKTEGDER